MKKFNFLRIRNISVILLLKYRRKVTAVRLVHVLINRCVLIQQAKNAAIKKNKLKIPRGGK